LTSSLIKKGVSSPPKKRIAIDCDVDEVVLDVPREHSIPLRYFTITGEVRTRFLRKTNKDGLQLS